MGVFVKGQKSPDGDGGESRARRGEGGTENKGGVLPLLPRPEHQGSDGGEDHRRGDAAGGGGKAAGEDPQPALLRHSLLNPFGQTRAKARQGYAGTRTPPFRNGRIHTDGLQKHAGHYIPRQDTGGGKLGFVDENLSDDT